MEPRPFSRSRPNKLVQLSAGQKRMLFLLPSHSSSRHSADTTDESSLELASASMSARPDARQPRCGDRGDSKFVPASSQHHFVLCCRKMWWNSTEARDLLLAVPRRGPNPAAHHPICSALCRSLNRASRSSVLLQKSTHDFLDSVLMMSAYSIVGIIRFAVAVSICAFFLGCAQTGSYAPKPVTASYSLDNFFKSNLQVVIRDLRAERNNSVELHLGDSVSNL